MRNLDINKGYKTYSINGDESVTITVKTTDFSIIDRLTKVQEHIGDIVTEMQSIKKNAAAEEYLAALDKADKKVKAELDEVFDSPVSAAVFGKMNSLSFAGGQPVALNFLESIIPEISAELEEEQKASAQKIEKYTAQVKQFK